MLSDDLENLRHNRFRIITRVFPVTGASAVALDLHRPSQTGIPCLLRLWCTDQSQADMSDLTCKIENDKDKDAKDQNKHTIQSVRACAFCPDRAPSNPFLRIRNCISSCLFKLCSRRFLADIGLQAEQDFCAVVRSSFGKQDAADLCFFPHYSSFLFNNQPFQSSLHL